MPTENDMIKPPELAEMTLQAIVAKPALSRLSNQELPVLIERMCEELAGGELLMSQFQLFSFLGNRDFALEMQARALALNTVYRIMGPKNPAIRLLALMGPGDSTDNMPLDYLLEDSDVQLDLLYLVPGQPLPDVIPVHDVAIIASGESAKNNQVLERLASLTARWPRPLLNPAQAILRCSRDGVYQSLKDISGLLIPPTQRVDRHEFAAGLPHDLSYPVTLRPLDSQSGRGLARIDHAAELQAYLVAENAPQFFASRFEDYRSRDGLYRKARIALIAGQPYVAHLAISEHWIVHYATADMLNSADKRREEADFMLNFDRDFARRHQAALRAIAARLELDYVVIDCAESRDGRLLVFEADNRGWVHATDPVDIFPYKQAPLRRLFAAFRSMLFKAAHS